MDGPFSIRKQLEAGKNFWKRKTGRRYIAYFQAYTNTYGPVDYLASIYRQALMEPDIAGISIATRPDCLGTEIMRLFASLKQYFRINSSGLSWDFRRSTKKRLCLSAEDIPSCLPKRWKLFISGYSCNRPCHSGLPGNGGNASADHPFLNRCGIFGIKLQLLHVLRGTDLAADHEAGLFRTYERDEYLNLVIDCLEHLRPDIVIHRVTGDGPKDLLIAPLWASRKREVLNLFITG